MGLPRWQVLDQEPPRKGTGTKPQTTLPGSTVSLEPAPREGLYCQRAKTQPVQQHPVMLADTGDQDSHYLSLQSPQQR